MYPETFYDLYNSLYGLYYSLYGLYNHFIVFSIVFYVYVYGVVICFKFCSLNSSFCKIIMVEFFKFNFFLNELIDYNLLILFD